jgi:peroxiredoxin
VVRGVPRDARLWTPSGTVTRLGDIGSGEPVILTVISRYCGASIAELQELSGFSRAMREQGIRVIAITADPPDSGTRSLLEQHDVDVPLYHDLRGQVNDALQAWETPTYFVLDDRGRLRFSRSLRIEIPRQIEALAQEVATAR